MNYRLRSIFGQLTVQGHPRLRGRAFGVPPAGAFDTESLRIANVLVGNSPWEAGLELGSGSLKIEAIDPTFVAIVGAAENASFRMAPGEVRSVLAGIRTGQSGESRIPGARSYIAIAPDRGQMPRRLVEFPQSLTRRTLRYVPLRPQAIPGEVTVSRMCDRAGIRLEERAVTHEIELPSEPVTPGVIQWTPSGQLIVLGPDGPTIGGYPKIGVICRADMNALGQLYPGDKFCLSPIDKAAAIEASFREEARIAARLDLITALGMGV